MHQSSLQNMEYFADNYCKSAKNVLDVGSFDVNGTYRQIFESRRIKYTGLDRKKGCNVDVVSDMPYTWKGIKSSSFDAVVSGQTFEHVERDDLLFKEMLRVLKPGGVFCIVAPSTGPKHEGDDFRRYGEQDAGRLAKAAGCQVKVIEAGVRIPSSMWNDMVIIGIKTTKEDAAYG